MEKECVGKLDLSFQMTSVLLQTHKVCSSLLSVTVMLDSRIQAICSELLNLDWMHDSETLTGFVK